MGKPPKEKEKHRSELSGPRRINWARALDDTPVWAASAAIVFSSLAAAGIETPAALPIHLLLYVFALFPMAFAFITGRRSLWRFPGWWAALAALIVLLAAAVFTVSPGRTLERLFEVLSALVVFLSFATAPQRQKPALWAVAAAATAGVAVSLLGLNEYILHYRAGEPAWRVFSTFYNPGFLSGFLALTAALTLGLLMARLGKAASWGLGIALVVQALGIALTGTRAGLAAFAGAALLLLIIAAITRLPDKTAWLRTGLVLAAVAAVVLLWGRPASQRVQAAGEEAHSLQFRIYTWQTAADMAQARPLTGFGPGSYEVATYPHLIAGYTRLAHSTYLQAASESGIPFAVLLFAGWFSLLAARAWALLRRRDFGNLETATASGALAAAAATSARGLLDSDWSSLPILLTAAAATGILVSLRHERELPGKSSLSWLLVLAGVAGTVLVYISQMAYAEMAAAEGAYEEGLGAEAREHWEQTARLTPWNVNARMRALQFRHLSEEEVPPQFARSYRALLPLEPTNPRIPYSAAEAYMRAGQDSLALGWLKLARERDPKSPRLLMDEARLMARAGRTEEAMRRWQRMLEIEKSPYGQVKALPQVVEPAYAWAHAAVGDDHLRQARIPQARQEWQASLEILQSFLGSMEEMGPVLRAAGLVDDELLEAAENLRNSVQNRLRSYPAPNS